MFGLCTVSTRAHITYFPLEASVDASKWTHFEDDGSDKGVMKLETEVGEGSGRRHLPSFVPLFAGNGGGRDLGRDDMPPTAADEMLLLQMAHSSFGSPVQFH